MLEVVYTVQGLKGDTAGAEGQDLKVFSKVLPVIKSLSLTRLDACPLPGFRISLLIIEQGLPPNISFKPFLN
jgi:hypothetical protein